MNNRETNANVCPADEAAMEAELRELLALVEKHIDKQQVVEVDARCRAALTFQEMDRPPLQVRAVSAGAVGGPIQLPDPWNRFRKYSFAETLQSAAAMMQCQILDFVVPGILLGDDNPMAIRQNCGTVLVAAVLGAKWQLYEGSNPWAERFGSEAELEEVLERPVDLDSSADFQKTAEAMRYFRRILDDYPACREVIQISLPDTQGPLDTVEQLWGHEVYYAVADRAPLLDQLLSKVADATVQAATQLDKLTRERLRPLAQVQNNHYTRGNLTLRVDSCIMLSPEHYCEVVRPHDAWTIENMGGGSIHFCGNGEHLIPALLDIPMMKALDLGQSFMMDAQSIYQMCRSKDVFISRLLPSREDLIGGVAQRQFPTGAVLWYVAESWEDAVQLVTQYYGRASHT